MGDNKRHVKQYDNHEEGILEEPCKDTTPFLGVQVTLSPCIPFLHHPSFCFSITKVVHIYMSLPISSCKDSSNTPGRHTSLLGRSVPFGCQAINVVSASGRLVCDTERCQVPFGSTAHFQALGWRHEGFWSFREGEWEGGG